MRLPIFALVMMVLCSVSAIGQQKTICIDGVCYPIVQTVPHMDYGNPVQTQNAVLTTQSQPTSLGVARDQQFRRVLIKAAEQSFREGELSRVDLLRLRVASLSPAKLQQMQTACAEQAVQEGKAVSIAAIDWEKLAAFIKEILPVIIEIVKLFG